MGDETTYKELLEDNRILFPRGGDGMPRKNIINLKEKLRDNVQVIGGATKYMETIKKLAENWKIYLALKMHLVILNQLN